MRPTTLSRRALAARELEERRLSLARRPSAPVIPHPGDLAFRPVSHERSNTDDMLNSMSMYRDPITRSQTADPEMNKRIGGAGPTSTTSVPIGLPANPRAMRHPRYMTADPNDEDDIPAVPSIPDNMQFQDSHSGETDDIGPLLPATTFGQPTAPPRSMSAPPQDILPSSTYNSPTFPMGRRPSVGGSRGHSRQNTMPDVLPQPNYKRHSPPPITASIAETIHEGQNQVIIIDQEEDRAPPLLSQLQHLATPPPPPPPPLNLGGHNGNGIGMINIAIDSNSPGEKPMEVSPTNPSATGSPHAHRRGRGSVSENLGMTFKRVTERMRSTSRGPQRAKSPPITMTRAERSPYESVPEFSFPRGPNTRSPPGDSGNHHDSYFNQVPPPPPPPPPMPQPMEQVIPPDNGQPFYRNPKELRANMPPNTLQAGVYQGGENTPMI